MPSIQLKGDSLIWALSAIAQLNRIPFDPKLILQQFPPPYTSETLHEAATSLGLKVGFKQVDSSALAQLSVPLLAVVKPVVHSTRASFRSARRSESHPHRACPRRQTAAPKTRTRTTSCSSSKPMQHKIAFFDGTSANIQALSSEEFGAAVRRHGDAVRAPTHDVGQGSRRRGAAARVRLLAGSSRSCSSTSISGAMCSPPRS